MWMDWYKVQTFKENTKSSQKLIQLNTQSPKVPARLNLKLRSTLINCAQLIKCAVNNNETKTHPNNILGGLVDFFRARRARAARAAAPPTSAAQKTQPHTGVSARSFLCVR